MFKLGNIKKTIFNATTIGILAFIQLKTYIYIVSNPSFLRICSDHIIVGLFYLGLTSANASNLLDVGDYLFDKPANIKKR